MPWIKKGLIFDPKDHIPFEDPIAQLPCVLQLSDTIVRVYYSYRDKGSSRPGYFELDLETDKLISAPSLSIGLNHGATGTFDEHGVMPSSIQRIGDKEIWMYYIGWSKGHSVPYHLSIGLAQSFDNGLIFQKYNDGPLIAQSFDEPFYATCPHVQRLGKLWRLWYSSGEAWIKGTNQMESRYIIKYRESNDGIHWSTPILLFEQNADAAIAAPSFCQINNRNILWYSERNVLNFREQKQASYRIQARELNDNGTYSRVEKYDLNPSEIGWDSEMTTYSQVFKINNKVYMLYNGNQFGRTGIGLAEWQN